MFPWPAVEPDRPATGVRSGKAVEGPAPARIRPSRPPWLKNLVLLPCQRCHTFFYSRQRFIRAGFHPGATNLSFDEWTEVFGSERLTGALLDRLTHQPASGLSLWTSPEQLARTFTLAFDTLDTRGGVGLASSLTVPQSKASPACRTRAKALFNVDSMVVAAKCMIRTYSTSADSLRHCLSAS